MKPASRASISKDIFSLKCIQFNENIFKDAIFKQVTFKENISFISNEFNEINFVGSLLKDIDLSSNNINKITVTPVNKNELDGVTLSPLQALEMIKLLGVKIK